MAAVLERDDQLPFGGVARFTVGAIPGERCTFEALWPPLRIRSSVAGRA